MNKLAISLGRLKNLLWISLLFTTSCQEWTPQADGYYIVDGIRYPVHIMTIQLDSSPQSSSGYIGVTLQGASGFNVSMTVAVGSNTLSKGNYHVSQGRELNRIEWVRFLRGNTSEDISSDWDSEGNMTVDVSSQNYKLDFSGEIKGHKVQIHYAGLVSFQYI